MNVNDRVAALAVELRSKDGAQRERARSALVKIGKPAVPRLINLLSDSDSHVRWEACKAFGSLRDPAASTALVEALKDDNVEVQWLAAEALIVRGEKSIVPLLQALKEHFDSAFLRQGTHHVLHALERQKKLKVNTLAVLDALRYLGPGASVAWAAKEALDSLKNNGEKSGGRG
jgi:HEAT repeat protein